jgi:hypothetical protein
MKVNEIIVEFKAQTTQADVANAKQIAANVKQANAKGDAQAAMAAGAALGDMLMNKTMPDLIRFMDYAIKELDKACTQYANDPNWAEQCKQMPQLKAELAAMKKKAMQDGVALGRQDVGETTTAGAIASVSAPMNGMQMQKRNPDGTAKNALDVDTNIMGNKKKAKKNKKD